MTQQQQMWKQLYDFSWVQAQHELAMWQSSAQSSPHSRKLSITRHEHDHLKVFWAHQLVPGAAHLNLNIFDILQRPLTNWRASGKNCQDGERCSQPYARNALEILGKSTIERKNRPMGDIIMKNPPGRNIWLSCVAPKSGPKTFQGRYVSGTKGGSE